MSATHEIDFGAAMERPPGIVRQALRLRRTQIGVVLFLSLAVVAFVGPFVAPYGSTEFVGKPNSRDIEGSLFGTDYFGQDVWSRFLFGGRSILILAVCATALGIVVGGSLGLIAAYQRGRIDEAIMRSFDIISGLNGQTHPIKHYSRPSMNGWRRTWWVPQVKVTLLVSI